MGTVLLNQLLLVRSRSVQVNSQQLFFCEVKTWIDILSTRPTLLCQPDRQELKEQGTLPPFERRRLEGDTN